MCKEKKKRVLLTCQVFHKSGLTVFCNLPRMVLGAQQKYALLKGKYFISFAKTGKFSALESKSLIMLAKYRNCQSRLGLACEGVPVLHNLTFPLPCLSITRLFQCT